MTAMVDMNYDRLRLVVVVLQQFLNDFLLSAEGLISSDPL